MVFGIIGIAIGAIWYIYSFAFSVDSAPQQTVQYLGFVCGSIFLVGGMLLLKLEKNNNNQLKNIDLLNKNFANFAQYYYDNDNENEEEEDGK